MDVYRKRVLDSELSALATLPALAIEGAKGVGKTATAQQRAATVVRLDAEDERKIAMADPVRSLEGEGPVLLDEWQMVPALWDAVRRAVDDGQPPGPFLLTGSATPPEPENEPSRHSGAGRIASLRMRPMALTERVDLEPTVSLETLLDQGQGKLRGDSEFKLADYAEEITRSGFPGIRDLEPRARRVQLDGYVTRIVDRDFKNELGRQVRRPETLRAWMAAYAASTATVTSMEKIRKAAVSGESAPAQATSHAYRDALLRLFVLDPIEGWLPGSSHLKRLAQAPKHHLVDPSLAVSLLGLSVERLLRGEGAVPALPIDRPFLGSLFESMVAQSVRVFAQAIEARVFHLRTRNGDHEVDLIVERPSGEVVAIEVKLAATVGDDDVKHLKWLKARIGDRLTDAVVITTGRFAYRRTDGIAVVPLALLGP